MTNAPDTAVVQLWSGDYCGSWQDGSQFCSCTCQVRMREATTLRSCDRRVGVFGSNGSLAQSPCLLSLSETLWSIPPHPACAMFVTNHGSSIDNGTGNCIPSSSTYAGRWYSLLTLGTNYHLEHHDFPTIPLHKLGILRKIAPEFYREGSSDNVFRIMRKAFAVPEFYACSDYHSS